MKWFGNMLAKIGLVESEEVRTRDKKGRYIADDPTTKKNTKYRLKLLRPLKVKGKQFKLTVYTYESNT